MSELTQVKKQLTFEEICPLWYSYLIGGPKSRDLHIGKHQFCVVGEANGFDLDKVRECDDCRHNHAYYLIRININRSYGPLTPEEINNNPAVIEFVNHWNERHINQGPPSKVCSY